MSATDSNAFITFTKDVEDALGSTAFESRLQEIIKAVNVRGLLNAFLHPTIQDSLTSRGCEASYFHSNGFLKLTLAGVAPEWVLRLHIWKGPPKINENDIHDHCGFFISRIIRGSLINQTFDFTGPNDGREYYEFRHTVGANPPVVWVGIKRLILTEETIINSNTTYFLPDTVIHRTIPTQDFPCITLVLQGPKRKTSSMIYRNSQRKSDASDGSFNHEEYISYIQEALNYAEASH